VDINIAAGLEDSGAWRVATCPPKMVTPVGADHELPIEFDDTMGGRSAYWACCNGEAAAHWRSSGLTLRLQNVVRIVVRMPFLAKMLKQKCRLTL
jgi:hypothetical protein